PGSSSKTKSSASPPPHRTYGPSPRHVGRMLALPYSYANHCRSSFGGFIMGKLEGRVAIITGGASGIGEGTVRLFAAEGARVVIADIQDPLGEELASELGDNVAYQRTNVSREDDVRACIQRAKEDFGRLDCLFNNA